MAVPVTVVTRPPLDGPMVRYSKAEKSWDKSEVERNKHEKKARQWINVFIGIL
tara:strand:+ start:3682 stop:3840 length:159 start_codon:yes stop_codon:yes gene_type:complete